MSNHDAVRCHSFALHALEQGFKIEAVQRALVQATKCDLACTRSDASRFRISASMSNESSGDAASAGMPDKPRDAAGSTDSAEPEMQKFRTSLNMTNSLDRRLRAVPTPPHVPI